MLLESAERTLGAKSQAQTKTIRATLESSTGGLSKELELGLNELFDKQLLVRMDPFYEPLQSVSYELSEIQFHEYSLADPFVDGFTLATSQLLEPFRISLTSNNFDALLRRIVDMLVRRVELECLRKSFNQLGALLLEKDVRRLAGFFASLSQKTLRDRFTRLSEIASLLNVERPADALELWNDANATWRLSAKEIRLFLRRRSDFRREQVKQLFS